jgi:hypothetical protein
MMDNRGVHNDVSVIAEIAVVYANSFANMLVVGPNMAAIGRNITVDLT